MLTVSGVALGNRTSVETSLFAERVHASLSCALLGASWEDAVDRLSQALGQEQDTRLARKWAETGTGAEPYNLAISGLLALLHRVSTRTLPRTKASLHQSLIQSGQLCALQRILWQLINPVAPINEPGWSKCAGQLLIIFGIPKSMNEISDFLAWENCDSAVAKTGMKAPTHVGNVYVHRSGGASLPIRLDSIHGVKGETHAATLIVETFARQHDLKELLPVLTQAKHGSQLTGPAHGHCKRLFVGMSRPSHLLCLAVSGDHVTGEQRVALANSGWKVVAVTG